MRKQKATVWCDRSQQEDPRIAAAQKQAKARAAREVTGVTGKSGAQSIGGSSGVRGKIRHHGAQKTVGYSPATLLVGASGVPARLSASEVGDEEAGEERGERSSLRRLGGGGGSGRSSLGSERRMTGSGLVAQRGPGRLSQSSTPPDAEGASPADSGKLSYEVVKEEETPVPGKSVGGDYFAGSHPKGSGGSGSSGERENSFGEVGSMQAPVSKYEGKGAEDLSRRGSVDERAMTMRGPRLFVANPDLSD